MHRAVRRVERCRRPPGRCGIRGGLRSHRRRGIRVGAGDGALDRRVAGPGRWLCIGAFLGTEPVGAAAAYIAAGYAWLGFAATLPDHRRRGAQQAMLALRLREAAVRGAHTAVVETGERLPDKPSNSYRNILRAGFEEIYLRKNYLSPAPR
ncbi:MAG: GNAT family N-acetyltransferase [Sulfurifustis sp.]